MYGSLGKTMEGYNQWYVKIMISQPNSYIPNFYTAEHIVHQRIRILLLYIIYLVKDYFHIIEIDGLKLNNHHGLNKN